MENYWLDIVTDNIEEGADNRLYVVRWVTDVECGYEHLVLTSKEQLTTYLANHNLDPEMTEVLEVQITKQFRWMKTVELKEAV